MYLKSQTYLAFLSFSFLFLATSCATAQNSSTAAKDKEPTESRWWEDENGKGHFEGEWWKDDKEKEKESDIAEAPIQDTKTDVGAKTTAKTGYMLVKNPNSKEAWNLYNGQVIKVGDGLKKMYWGDPSVLKDGDTYRMWFTGGNMKGLNHVRVYHATSTDGIDWKINTTPIVKEGPKGSWDDERTETPSVIKVGKTYHMYYTGFKTGDAVARFNIGHATSRDGINWTKDPRNPIVSNHDDISKWGLYYVAEPGAVYNPKDELFYLYYGTAKGNYEYKGKNSDLQSTSAIVLATSKDGSRFKPFDRDGDGNQDAVFEPKNYYTTNRNYRGFSTPHAFIGSDGFFHLFVDAVYAKKGWKQDALVHAKSNNGKSFATVSNDIILRENAKWIAREVIGPTVIEDNGEYLMWFGGHGDDFFKNFGISFARKPVK
ncbi:MAG: putative GH43/DUF377 family glycosyl hydrolase [Halioglobus sp.]|jgi:predicted GH43/DUF377 family glycosyl hydrolase